MPPARKVQDRILKVADSKFSHVDPVVKNSLKQYECQSFYFKTRFWLLFNFVSLILIFPLVFVQLFRGLFGPAKPKQKLKRISLSKVDFEDLKSLDITKVKKAFGYIKPSEYRTISQVFLTSGFRPYFWLRAVWKIAMYSELVDLYKPSEIWVTQEMVFESSLLTHFLKRFGVQHINFMHGDNFYSIQIAFSSFTKFYIWDDYYKGLFQMLHMEVDEYCVFDPMPVKKNVSQNVAEPKIFKYYAQNSVNAKEFQGLIEKLREASLKRGCKLVIRLHPLHKKNYEEEIIKKFNIDIEMNNDKNIEQSLHESSYVCSVFSTVLYQAHRMNKSVIIDNSVREDFELIKDLEPIYLKKYNSELLFN